MGSRQRQRHQHRQPAEQRVQLSLANLVGDAGDVLIERHSYDWRPDDLLVRIQLDGAIEMPAFLLLKLHVAEVMHRMLPTGEPLGDWFVVFECGGTKVASFAWFDELSELGQRSTGNG